LKQKGILILILVATLLAPASFADKLTDGTTTIYDEIEGGGQKLEGGGYTIYDSKSFLGDKFGDGTGSYTIIPGILGLLGLEVTWSEDPHVRELRISRTGSDIAIEWTATPESYTGPFYVYKLAQSFENVSTNWSQIATVTGQEYHYDTGQVGEGNAEAYYRVISVDRVSACTNKVAVGKVNVAVGGGKKWTLFSMPFMQSPSSLNELIGGHLGYSGSSDPGTAVRVFSHEGGGWNRASYFNGSNWVSMPGLSPAVYDGNKGLYLLTRNNDPDAVLTIVGKIKPPYEITEYLIAQNWNVMGFPYPFAMDLNTINLNGGTRNDNAGVADRVYGRSNHGFNTASYLKADGTWAAVPGLSPATVQLAKPLYYLSKSSGDVPYSITPSELGYH
jgi:hypothetical protein